MQMKKLAQQGFTLIELMIVVAIIGILIAVAAPMLYEASGKAKRVEATIQLDKLKKRAIEEYNANTTFPLVNAPVTPGTPCGCQANKKCAPTPAEWDTTEWRALEFAMSSEPFLFQYGYTFTNGGNGFDATATADMDCDGTMITYTLNGSVASGAPQYRVTPPQNAD